MTASNHAVTGALIAATVPYPVIGLPLAFASHFALDALPHWNYGSSKSHRARKFIYFLAIDAGIAAAVMLSLTILQPVNWAVVVFGSLLAMSPDLMWLPYWIQELRGKRVRNDRLDKVSRLHKLIQHEYARGILIEIIWLLVFGYLLLLNL